MRLLECFVLEVTAISAADILGIHLIQPFFFTVKYVKKVQKDFRMKYKKYSMVTLKIDESYFGGIRKGKRGRGAAGKVVAFGMLKRHGKVYTVIVENTKEATLMPAIANKIRPDSFVYTDTYHSYDALDVSEFHHHRINHSEEFANQKNHINGIENFWNQAK